VTFTGALFFAFSMHARAFRLNHKRGLVFAEVGCSDHPKVRRFPVPFRERDLRIGRRGGGNLRGASPSWDPTRT
jgi:hypothetical protein